MKIHKRLLQGITVTAYNDSGADWVVMSVEHGTMRYPCKFFTLKQALNFYMQTFNNKLTN